jgi:hypothetical protein
MQYLQKLDFDWIEMLNFYERPFRAKLVPSKIWKDLDVYRNDEKGLSNYFKKWRTKIEWRPRPSNAKVFDTYVAIGGEYGPEERQCTIQIYTLEFQTFKFSPKTWDAFKYRMIQTLMHELIHLMQYDRRNDLNPSIVVPYKKVGIQKKDSERRYLSEFDEIQAYANCVYLDFKTNKPRVPLETLLKRIKTDARYDSKTLHYFLKTFDYDFRNNISPRKLIEHIGKWDRKYNKMI